MITSRSNIFPGYNIVKRGREVKIKENSNASKAEMTADYDNKWEFYMGFRKKRNV